MTYKKMPFFLFIFSFLLTFSSLGFAGEKEGQTAIPAAYQSIQFEIPNNIKEENVALHPSAQQECYNQCSVQQNDCNFWAENNEALQKCDFAKSQCDEVCKNLSVNPPRAAAYY